MSSVSPEAHYDPALASVPSPAIHLDTPKATGIATPTTTASLGNGEARVDKFLAELDEEEKCVLVGVFLHMAADGAFPKVRYHRLYNLSSVVPMRRCKLQGQSG